MKISEMSEEQNACACLRVDYDPEEVSGGKMRERWVCHGCQTEFVKHRFDSKELPNLKEEMKGLKEKYENVVGRSKPWSLQDVLTNLLMGCDILLHDKNYDQHGWELIAHCMKEADTVIDVLKTSPQQEKEDVK